MEKSHLIPFSKSNLNNRRGQVIVEYVLLLVVAVTIAALMTRSLIGSDNERGIIVTAWSKVVSAIGADPADDIKRN